MDATHALRVCALYPDLMNIYADRGNLIVLERRCRWRGLGFELEPDCGAALAQARRSARDNGAAAVLAGFENHGGRTTLGPGARPLGRVLKGHGNDGESGFEGARAGGVIGTYMHGPLLPKN